jgi:hypothetical protein
MKSSREEKKMIVSSAMNNTLNYFASSVRQDTRFVSWNEGSPPCNDPFGM